MSEGESARKLRLAALLAEAGIAPLDAEQADHFEAYLSLFVRWNERVNLTSDRKERVRGNCGWPRCWLRQVLRHWMLSRPIISRLIFRCLFAGMNALI